MRVGARSCTHGAERQFTAVRRAAAEGEHTHTVRMDARREDLALLLLTSSAGSIAVSSGIVL